MDIDATEFLISLPRGRAIIGIDVATPRYLEITVCGDCEPPHVTENFIRGPQEIIHLSRNITLSLGGTEENYRKIAMFMASLCGFEYAMHCIFSIGIPMPDDWETDYYAETHRERNS